jgi:hypothetical protein
VPLVTDGNGGELIPLTVGEARRQFSLHTRVTQPDGYHDAGHAGAAVTRLAPAAATTSSDLPPGQHYARAAPAPVAARS